MAKQRKSRKTQKPPKKPRPTKEQLKAESDRNVKRLVKEFEKYGVEQEHLERQTPRPEDAANYVSVLDDRSLEGAELNIKLDAKPHYAEEYDPETGERVQKARMDEYILGHLPPDAPIKAFAVQFSQVYDLDKKEEGGSKDESLRHRYIEPLLGSKAEADQAKSEGGTRMSPESYSAALSLWKKLRSSLNEDSMPGEVEKEAESRLGRQWKHILSSLYPYFHSFKYLRGEDYMVCLSTRSARKKLLYKSPAVNAHKLKKLVALGVVHCACSKYHFDLYDVSNSQSRYYLIDKVAAKAYLDYCEAKGLGEWCKDDIWKKDGSIEDLDRCERQIAAMKAKEPDRFKRLIEIVRLDRVCIPKSEYTEDEIKAAVYAKYPDVRRTIANNAEINRRLPPHLRHKAEVSVHGTEKNWTRIGFRDTHAYVSLKKRPKEMAKHPEKYSEAERTYDSTGHMYKEAFLERMYPEGYVSCDQHSSILRITYADAVGSVPRDEEDFYANQYPELAGTPEWRNFIRAWMKGISLFVGFNVSPKAALARFMYGEEREHVQAFVGAYGEEKAVEAIKTLMDLANEVQGGKPLEYRKGTEVFAKESAVLSYAYLKLIRYCRKKHCPMPFQVYDEIFMSKKAGIGEEELRMIIHGYIEEAGRKGKRKEEKVEEEGKRKSAEDGIRNIHYVNSSPVPSRGCLSRPRSGRRGDEKAL